MTLLWCEARCAGLYDPEVAKCAETAEGGFGVRDGRRAALAAGWRVVSGDWFCPACLRRKANARQTPEKRRASALPPVSAPMPPAKPSAPLGGLFAGAGEGGE